MINKRGATELTSILIIHHNTYDDLVRLLEALHGSPLRRTLVVDNASHDRRLDLLPTQFPSVEILSLEENLGYSAAVNAAGNASAGSASCY